MSEPCTFEIEGLEEVRAAHPDMLICGIRPEGPDGLLVQTEAAPLAVTLILRGRAGQRIALRFRDPNQVHRLERGISLAGSVFAHNLRRRAPPALCSGTLAILLAAGAFLWSGRDGGDSPTGGQPAFASAEAAKGDLLIPGGGRTAMVSRETRERVPALVSSRNSAAAASPLEPPAGQGSPRPITVPSPATTPGAAAVHFSAK